MSSPQKLSPKVAGPAGAAATTGRPSAALTCGIAWLIPGGGHFVQGQVQKAAIFFAVLVFMFVFGLSCGGRAFPFQNPLADPLVFLAAAAEWALGGPRLLAALAGWGSGDVIAATYEYGNTFLIVSGLLNALVVLDAYDLASGRKTNLS